jgi:hypothetical protein
MLNMPMADAVIGIDPDHRFSPDKSDAASRVIGHGRAKAQRPSIDDCEAAAAIEPDQSFREEGELAAGHSAVSFYGRAGAITALAQRIIVAQQF